MGRWKGKQFFVGERIGRVMDSLVSGWNNGCLGK